MLTERYSFSVFERCPNTAAAPWCGHCKAIFPKWEKAATATKGIVTMAKVDAVSHSVEFYKRMLYRLSLPLCVCRGWLVCFFPLVDAFALTYPARVSCLLAICSI